MLDLSLNQNLQHQSLSLPLLPRLYTILVLHPPLPLLLRLRSTLDPVCSSKTFLNSIHPLSLNHNSHLTCLLLFLSLRLQQLRLSSSFRNSSSHSRL